MEKVQRTFWATKREIDEWKRFAETHSMDLSSLVRRAVRAYIIERITPNEE